MKKLLLALFLVGCGETTTNWDVRIGEEASPLCTGSMALDQNVSGTWSCGTFAGGAKSDFLRVPGMSFLNLETAPGFWNGVRGVGDDKSIDGTILLDGAETPFAAAVNNR